MVAGLVDGVVKPLERLADPLPGQLRWLARGLIQAEADMKQA